MVKNPIDLILSDWKSKDELQKRFSSCSNLEERKSLLKEIRPSLTIIDQIISIAHPEMVTGISLI